MQNLNEILEQIWPKIRARHFYPELPAPQLTEGSERVGPEMKGKNISLSTTFINEVSQFLAPQFVLEGLLDHAVSHYTYCPWDFSTHLLLYKEARSVVHDKNKAKTIADRFMDVVADTHCVSRHQTPLPEIYRHLQKGRLDNVMCALYQKIWGLDLGADPLKATTTRLARIPYMDRNRWRESIRRFAFVIQEFLEEDEAPIESQSSSRMGAHDLRQYASQEIEQGLQRLASNVATPAEFNTILRDIQEDVSDAFGKICEGIGFGNGGSIDADILYYMKRAQKYALPIRKRPMQKSGSLYPHHHVPWEAGRPIYNIDAWKSFGKIMPGLTKAWQHVEGEVYGQAYGTPDCLVIIDSSRSMVDPEKKISPAVLGGACAVNAYLRNGAHAAVYNFSDAGVGDELILPYTRNRRALYGALCRYFGGGTQLFVKRIQALQTDPSPDIFLITDMQITNLETLVHYFKACENRITAVHIGTNKHTEIFRQMTAMRQNVNIYGVQHPDDIPGIVLGSVRAYLYTS